MLFSIFYHKAIQIKSIEGKLWSKYCENLANQLVFKPKKILTSEIFGLVTSLVVEKMIILLIDITYSNE